MPTQGNIGTGYPPPPWSCGGPGAAACSRGVPLRTSLASPGTGAVCCNRIPNVRFHGRRAHRHGNNGVNDKYFGSHELHGREHVVQGSSDRGFGYVFAGFAALVGALSLYNGGTHWPYWLAAAVMFALVAFYRPSLLAPLNRLWTKLGLVLFAVVSPLALGIVYYGCITPVGWLMRLSGKDPLRLRFEPERKSYWEARQPPGPPPNSLMNQF